MLEVPCWKLDVRSRFPNNMQAILITRPGGPEVLEIHDVPAPEPGPHQVLVRVRAFSLNRADLMQCRGLYPAPPGWPQDIPGLEFAGEVEALGSGVSGVAVGDRVMGIVGGGSYAEYLVTPAAHLMPIPEGLSFEDAAAIPEAFLTAYDAIRKIALASGEWVLVHAVGSGVGTAVVQLAKMRGAQSIGTTRTPWKLERAEELGLDVGIDSTNEELVPAVLNATGQGAQTAVDLIGGALFPQTLDALARRGRLILVGLTAGRRAELDLGVLLGKRLRIEGTVLRSRSDDEKATLTRAFVSANFTAFADGRLVPVVDRVFEMTEVRTAHEYLESNANFGNVVVRVG
jgi:NADPH:quinone reductase